MKKMDSPGIIAQFWFSILESLRIYFIGVFLISILFGAIAFDHYRHERALIKQMELASLELGRKSIKNVFDSVTSDLSFLANSPQLKQFITESNVQNHSLLSQSFLNLAKSKYIYDQIRFIDENGVEVVRINNNHGSPVIISEAALQDKKKRYYFESTFSLKKGEIFVSPLDLNIENGKIEQPLKPMIRFGTPVFNADGQKLGIILLNYFAEFLLADLHRTILQTVSHQVEPFLFHGVILERQPMLLNKEGYWLMGPNAKDEWGFMFRHNRSFAQKHPETWRQIAKTETDQQDNNHGIFSHLTFYPLPEDKISTMGSSQPVLPSEEVSGAKAYSWKLVSHLPPAQIRALRSAHLKDGLLLLIFILLPWGILSLYLGYIRNQTKLALQQKEESQEALTISEAKFRTVADFTYDWEYWIDENRQFVYVSPSCEKITDYRPQEFFEDPSLVFSLVHPDDQDIFNEHMKNEFLETSACHHEFRIISKNGEIRWIDHICQPVYDSAGKFTGRRGTNRDMTDKKIAEQKVKQSEFRQRLVLQLYAKEKAPVEELNQIAADNLVALTESEFGFWSTMDESESLFTVQCWSKDVKEKCALVDLPKSFDIQEEGVWADIIRRRQAIYENDYQSSPQKKGYPPGHLDIQRFLVVPVIENNRIVALGAVANKKNAYTPHDIQQMVFFLESMWSLISKKKADEAVMQANEEWERTFESVPDMVCIIDTHYQILRANRAMIKILGTTPENCIGKTCCQSIHQLEEPPPQCPHAKLLEDGKPHETELFEPSLNAYLHVTVNPLKNQNGTLLGSVHVARDITRRKEIERLLRGVNQLKEELLAPGTLNERLAIITQRVTDIFHLEFARIWILRPGDLCERDCFHAETLEGPHVCKDRSGCLHLMASSGIYTHTDGREHRRVPLGCYKIGRIAAAKDNTFLTNDVPNDPMIHDHAWAKELGLQSFAGYKLASVSGQPIGVMAMFSKQTIIPEVDNLLEGVANTVAQVIVLCEAEESLREYAENQKILLREVNHRVKNNLTAMISMLHKEEDRAENEGFQDCKSRMQDIVFRVEGLLVVHSLLSSSKWQPLSLSQLCSEIIGHTIRGMASHQSFDLKINDCAIFVTSDQAHNLTLILNELATNTVKYGMGATKAAAIQVALDLQDDVIHLVYRDNGAGYPEPLIAGEIPSKSIGFHLITGLVKKSLRGKLEVFNEGGAVTHISFPMMKADENRERIKK